ncbi:MAG: hypothetical protein ACI8X5_002657 [Planctomycetota bacterium]|jgi:hypothetical protein
MTHSKLFACEFAMIGFSQTPPPARKRQREFMTYAADRANANSNEVTWSGCSIEKRNEA